MTSWRNTLEPEVKLEKDGTIFLIFRSSKGEAAININAYAHERRGRTIGEQLSQWCEEYKQWREVGNGKN